MSLKRCDNISLWLSLHKYNETSFYIIQYNRSMFPSGILFCPPQVLNLALTLYCTGVKLYMECLWSVESFLCITTHLIINVFVFRLSHYYDTYNSCYLSLVVASSHVISYTISSLVINRCDQTTTLLNGKRSCVQRQKFSTCKKFMKLPYCS